MRARVKNVGDIPDDIFCCKTIFEAAKAKQGRIIEVEPAPQFKTWTCSACGKIHIEQNVLFLVTDGSRKVMPACALDIDEGDLHEQ